MMREPFEFLMIGAMYENGGNATHRLLDGHPELFVYPFESQLGTRNGNDLLSSVFPAKYRWPVFALHATPAEDFAAIIDEECRVRIHTPGVSKFRDSPFELSDGDRCVRFIEQLQNRPRTRGANVEAFFRATFDCWRNRASSGRERIYVGYSPIVTVDASAILSDFEDAHVLHVVRNPWSAYADTKRRAVPMAMDDYMSVWSIVQHSALSAKLLFPDRVHVVRTEDLFRDPVAGLAPVLKALSLPPDETLKLPSWNGTPLSDVVPWGTIRRATTEANLAAAGELSPEEHERIAILAGPYLDAFDYSADEWRVARS